MRDSVRILQAGDLHIGTAFSGSGFAVEKARKRRRELLGTFRRLCEAAEAQQVDVLLLVGDLFEAEWVSEAEVAEVRQLLGACGRPVCISPGNHDALLPGGPYSFGQWPDNVHLFGPQVSAVTFAELGLTVHGYGYGAKWVRENPFQGYRVPKDGHLHVVMIHGSFDAPENTPYLPIGKADVQALGADYVAFGHYHQPQVLLDAGGLLQAAYAGSLEPLGFDETDEHGALLLDVRQGGARAEWLNLAQRAYLACTVDVEGCTSLHDVAERIRQQVPAERRGRDLLEVTLVGAMEWNWELDRADLLERLSDVAFHWRLVDQTHPDLDSDAYASASAAGRFVAKMRERIRLESDPQKRQVLEQALTVGLIAFERGKVIRA